MRLSQILATALCQIGVQHVMATPAPQVVAPDLAAAQADLLRRLCQNPVLNAPPPEFNGTTYIRTGHVDGTKPDPTTYLYDIFRLSDVLFTNHALSLTRNYREQITKTQVLANPVPQGFEVMIPYELVNLRVTVAGDMNIIFSNILGCLDKFDGFYGAQTGNTVPFLQCSIHEDNYLQGKAEMVAVKPSAEQCASVSVPDSPTQ